jgi:FkbM family methyltransferase
MKRLINKILGNFGLELHGTGYLQALAKGEFHRDSFSLQKQLATKASIIFDIGANRGDVSAEYLKHFPAATIYAFEPFPGTFQSLQAKFAGNQRLKCFPFAVSSTEGSDTFYVNKNVDTNSLLRPQETGLSSDNQVKNISTIKVDTISLDTFCNQNGIDRIDILKMDIQGGELNVLKGALRLLENRKVGIIYSEVFFVEQYENTPLFHDISKFLHGFGYTLQDIYNPMYGQGNIAWADVIFTKA